MLVRLLVVRFDTSQREPVTATQRSDYLITSGSNINGGIEGLAQSDNQLLGRCTLRPVGSGRCRRHTSNECIRR